MTTKKLPAGFQIRIKSRVEWELAWECLSKHYELSTNSDERRYSRGCMIKVGTTPVRLWTSSIGMSPSFTTYGSWEEFLNYYLSTFITKKVELPTFNHCAELVSLDQDMAILQIEIADMEEALAKQKELMEKHLTRTAELNTILGIN